MNNVAVMVLEWILIAGLAATIITLLRTARRSRLERTRLHDNGQAQGQPRRGREKLTSPTASGRHATLTSVGTTMKMSATSS